MTARLPDLASAELWRRLQEVSPLPLEPPVLRALEAHYRELVRWSPRLSLLGPRAASEIFPRHYGESLAALPLLAEHTGRLLDLGSGAGFPGLVLAAARPDLEVTLVESRQRKWAFLRQAVMRAGLSCRCLDARVQPGQPLPVPETFDLLTVRAVKITFRLLAAVRPHLGAGARVLVWTTSPDTLPHLLREERRAPLPGSTRRCLVVARLVLEGAG